MPADRRDEAAKALYPEATKNVEPTEAEPPPTWEPPIPLGTISLPEFPTTALPPWLCEFVEAEAEATQTPPDVAAMLVLAVVATACAKRVAIQLKDGYVEPVNLFTLTVLPPGNRKSSVFNDVVAPLVEFEKDQVAEMAPRIAEACSRLRMAQEALKQLERQAVAAKPGQGQALERLALNKAAEVERIKIPAALRLVTDDCSPERLASLLQEQGGRIAVLATEGDVFRLMAGRYSATGASNLGVYQRGHSGDALRVDRVHRPSEYVPAPALTIGLTIQPDLLHGIMLRPDFRGLGLLGRFLYALPKSMLGRRNDDSAPVSRDVSDAYSRGVYRLLALSAGTDPSGAPVPNLLTLAPDARRALRGFVNWLEPRLGEFGDLGHISDWAGKLAGAVGRLAALLHVAEPERLYPWETPVAASTVENAITIGKYLVPHAIAAFGAMGADPEAEGARQLLGWIGRTGAPTFTKREAFEGSRGRFKNVPAMEPALALLVEHRFIRELPAGPRTGPGRRPSTAYQVNPDIVKYFADDPMAPGPAGDSAYSAHSAEPESAETKGAADEA